MRRSNKRKTPAHPPQKRCRAIARSVCRLRAPRFARAYRPPALFGWRSDFIPARSRPLLAPLAPSRFAAGQGESGLTLFLVGWRVVATPLACARGYMFGGSCHRPFHGRTSAVGGRSRGPARSLQGRWGPPPLASSPAPFGRALADASGYGRAVSRYAGVFVCGRFASALSSGFPRLATLLSPPVRGLRPLTLRDPSLRTTRTQNRPHISDPASTHAATIRQPHKCIKIRPSA